MKINRIEKGCGDVTLFPEDCFWLAKACHEALGRVPFAADDQVMRLMSSTFTALGVAMEAQVHMRQGEQDDLRAVVEEGLEAVLFPMGRGDEACGVGY